MDGDRRLPPAATLASAAAVLGNNDLLREILLRLGFPTCLVHAALVSKRWLHHASNPAFLRHFRERNPPRVLGVFACYPGTPYKFLPLLQPPELAALSRRAASSFDGAFTANTYQRVVHCRNSRLITVFLHEGTYRHSLLEPLLAGESEAVLPQTPLPRHLPPAHTQGVFSQTFLPEDGGRDGITLVSLWKVWREVRAEVCVLGSGGWGVPTTAVTEVDLPYAETNFIEMLPPVHGKVFMVTGFGYTLGLDLATSNFFTLELPVGVRSNYMLSCAEGSGIYLFSADGFHLSVWLHGMMGNSDGAGGWLLVDTFCVRCSAGHDWVWMAQDGDFLGVAAVEDNAEFVFLDYARYGVVLYVHLRSRVVEKVHEQALLNHHFIRPDHIHISSFMMIWPPIFPALNGRHDQK
ncbi:LOW QUALITY PROTEIN: hypothetical protein CFC21_049784 [Triticum aestivum]|uniref:Uncharacterized protein n=2 Tax=Triticum aestivum TaxID=4565 RepID=A0A3B6H0J9_WHEAT|nr:LOW QUALITY PROTEIN: hypothetical protein CFC21_049784 [Triticum aestivum]